MYNELVIALYSTVFSDTTGLKTELLTHLPKNVF